MTTFKRVQDADGNWRLEATSPPPVISAPADVIKAATSAAKDGGFSSDDTVYVPAIRSVTAADAKATAVKTLRTFGQGFAGAVVLTLPTSLTVVHDWSTAKATAISLAASSAYAGATAAFAYLHNTLEDRGIIRSRKGY